MQDSSFSPPQILFVQFEVSNSINIGKCLEKISTTYYALQSKVIKTHSQRQQTVFHLGIIIVPLLYCKLRMQVTCQKLHFPRFSPIFPYFPVIDV